MRAVRPAICCSSPGGRRSMASPAGRLGENMEVEAVPWRARQRPVDHCPAGQGTRWRPRPGGADRQAGGLCEPYPEFVDQPRVINGASDLMVEVFGDKGRHARSAVASPSCRWAYRWRSKPSSRCRMSGAGGRQRQRAPPEQIEAVFDVFRGIEPPPRRTRLRQRLHAAGRGGAVAQATDVSVNAATKALFGR